MVKLIILDDTAVLNMVMPRADIMEAFPSLNAAVEHAKDYTNKIVIGQGCSKCLARSKMNTNISKELKKAIGLLSDEDKQKFKEIMKVATVRVVFVAKDSRVVSMEF